MPQDETATDGNDERETPRADEVTEEDQREQTRRAERIQQSGEGIHGVNTQPGSDPELEEDVRRTVEGRD